MKRFFRDPTTGNHVYPAHLLRVWRPAPGERHPVVHLSETWVEVCVHWLDDVRVNRLCELDSGCRFCRTGAKRQLQAFAVVAPMADLSVHRLLQFSSHAAGKLLSEAGDSRSIHGLAGVYSRLGQSKNSPLDFEPIRRIRTGIEKYSIGQLEESVLRLMTRGKNSVLYSDRTVDIPNSAS